METETESKKNIEEPATRQQGWYSYVLIYVSRILDLKKMRRYEQKQQLQPKMVITSTTRGAYSRPILKANNSKPI